MRNRVTHLHSTTSRQVRKALRRTRLYRALQVRVSRRLGVSKPTVSKAASGRFPGRYKRVELALLEELVRLEPELGPLVEQFRGQVDLHHPAA